MSGWREETIGDARLICADCLEVLPTLEPVDAVVTDPPYNVGFSYASHDDAMPEAEYLSWIERVFSAIPWQDRASLLWFWQGIRVAIGQVPEVLPRGFAVHHLAAWFKNEFAGDLWKGGHPAYSWEPIIWATNCVIEYAGPCGGHDGRDCLIGISSRHDLMAKGHPCPKTESVVEKVCRWIPTDAILDPFMGSGTTGVACANLGRKFIGIEIEPKYFTIACRRIRDAYAQPRLPLEEPEPAPQELGL